MATIDSKAIIDKIIANDGLYADDPPVEYIDQYETPEGQITYGVCYTGQDLLNYLDSPFCNNQRMLWKRGHY